MNMYSENNTLKTVKKGPGYSICLDGLMVLAWQLALYKGAGQLAVAHFKLESLQ